MWSLAPSASNHLCLPVSCPLQKLLARSCLHPFSSEVFCMFPGSNNLCWCLQCHQTLGFNERILLSMKQNVFVAIQMRAQQEGCKDLRSVKIYHRYCPPWQRQIEQLLLWYQSLHVVPAIQLLYNFLSGWVAVHLEYMSTPLPLAWANHLRIPVHALRSAVSSFRRCSNSIGTFSSWDTPSRLCGF